MNRPEGEKSYKNLSKKIQGPRGPKLLKFWFCFTLLAEIDELNRMNSSSEVLGGIIRQVIVAQITQMADGLIQKRKRKALHKAFPSETLALTKHSAEKRGRFSEGKSRMPSTPDLFRDGEEAADGEGAVGVRLTPGLHLTTVLGVVSDDKQ